jgi:hypothetical protein
VLTAGRRCRRRRPGVGGGAASVFTAALDPLLRSGSSSITYGASPSSGSSRTRPSAAASRRRRRGSPASPAPPSLLYLPPPASPSAAALEGAKPQCGLVARPTVPCLPPLAFDSAAPQGRGDFPVLPPGLDRSVPVAAPASPSHAAAGTGARRGGSRGFSPSRPWLGSRAAPGPSACAPAGRLGRAPRRASGCDGTGGGAVGWAGWLAG